MKFKRSLSPYFTIRSGDLGSGWVSGNVLRFNTDGVRVPTFNRQTPAPRPKFRRGVVRSTLPDFLYKCTNVINMEKRIAFRVDTPCDSLMACHLCDEDTKKQCEKYDWIKNGWT